jgi:hypothetical protein
VDVVGHSDVGHQHHLFYHHVGLAQLVQLDIEGAVCVLIVCLGDLDFWGSKIQRASFVPVYSEKQASGIPQ